MISANSISSGTYMSILYRLFFRRRWWLLLLPVLVCLALIAIDTRFAYVALIVAMAMVMISLPILYYYALTPESRWSILKKTALITDDGLQLDFSDDKMHQHIIPWSDISSTTALNNCLVLRFKKNSYTFLAIPLNAFSGEEELRKFVIEIRRRISNKVAH